MELYYMCMKHLGCSVSNCYRLHYAKGLCNPHYQLQRLGRDINRLDETVEQKLWRRVKKGAARDCWLWTGPFSSGGYGIFHHRGTDERLAHRVSYALHRGSIPFGHVICHRCDNPLCVNPAHLFSGTYGHGRRTQCS